MSVTPQTDSHFYDAKWDTWDAMKVYGPTARHTRRFVLKLLADITFESLLDIGCGTGLLLQQIALRYPHVKIAGSEFSQRAIEIALQRVPHADFFSLDIEREQPAQKYDVVTCIDVLEHIPDDEAALRNLRAATNKYLILSVPLGPLFEVEMERYGHVHGYTRREIERKIERTGFKIVRAIQWGFPFYNLHRRLVNALPSGATTSSYSQQKKILAQILYLLFFLNISPGGERYYALCERV